MFAMVFSTITTIWRPGLTDDFRKWAITSHLLGLKVKQVCELNVDTHKLLQFDRVSHFLQLHQIPIAQARAAPHIY